MKPLLILFVVVLVTSGVVMLARGWIADRRARRPDRWRVEERSDGELVTLHAVRRDDQPLLLGSVPIGAADFDSRLYELRAQAGAKIVALNQGRSLRA